MFTITEVDPPLAVARLFGCVPRPTVAAVLVLASQQAVAAALAELDIHNEMPAPESLGMATLRRSCGVADMRKVGELAGHNARDSKQAGLRLIPCKFDREAHRVRWRWRADAPRTRSR